MSNEVPNDQEVIGKSEFLDHTKFAIEPIDHNSHQFALRTHFLVVCVAFKQTLDTQGPEVLVGARLIFWDLK